MFVPGQLVVCVDGTFPPDSDLYYGDETFVVAGAVYTVRETFLEFEGTHTITVEEIVNPAKDYADGEVEFHFAARRFRPLDDTKLDVFRAVLTDAPKDRETVE